MELTREQKSLTREEIEFLRPTKLEANDDWGRRMNLLCDMALRSLQSDSRAAMLLQALQSARDVIADAPPDTWGSNSYGDYSVPGGTHSWSNQSEYLHHIDKTLEAARSVLSPTAPDDQDSASDVRKEALVSDAAAARSDMVLVPKEPTREMLDAALRAMGAYCEPYDPEYEEGVEVSCGMSQADADHINEQQREAQADQYRAMIAARPWTRQHLQGPRRTP